MKKQLNYLILTFIAMLVISCTKDPACYKICWQHRLSSGVHKAETTHWKFRRPLDEETFECWKQKRTDAIIDLHPTAYNIEVEFEESNSAPFSQFYCSQ